MRNILNGSKHLKTWLFWVTMTILTKCWLTTHCSFCRSENYFKRLEASKKSLPNLEITFTIQIQFRRSDSIQAFRIWYKYDKKIHSYLFMFLFITEQKWGFPNKKGFLSGFNSRWKDQSDMVDRDFESLIIIHSLFNIIYKLYLPHYSLITSVRLIHAIIL